MRSLFFLSCHHSELDKSPMTRYMPTKYLQENKSYEANKLSSMDIPQADLFIPQSCQ